MSEEAHGMGPDRAKEKAGKLDGADGPWTDQCWKRMSKLMREAALRNRGTEHRSRGPLQEHNCCSPSSSQWHEGNEKSSEVTR